MKVSIVIPVYGGDWARNFIARALRSIAKQTYRNVEVVMPDNSDNNDIFNLAKLYRVHLRHFKNPRIGMAQNTNEGIKKATGDIIKILYMDDYFAHDNAIKEIVEAFNGGWLVTGNTHNNGEHLYSPRLPSFNGILNNQNTIGSPSVLTIENKDPLLFDEKMTWLLDVDYYKRLYAKYGEPTILDSINVVIGTGEHQVTQWLSDEIKQNEEEYLANKI